MLEVTRTVNDNLTDHPMLLSYMEWQGMIQGEPSPVMGSLRLGDVLQLRNMDKEQFMADYEKFVREREDGLHHTSDNEEYMLYGRIPCVVQLPIQDMLDAEMAECSYNIALAEFGRQWLEEAFKIKEPSILMGTGIEGLTADSRIMSGEYSVADCAVPYNQDFEGMEDVRGVFRILTAIPLVMVIDTRQANGRMMPESMEQLLLPEYKDSIMYPDDGHMLDSIMLTYFYHAAGIEGVYKFRKNAIGGAHPSQMIKPGGLEKKPFIMLMPWIFATIKAKEDGMCLVWPGDGAPILPLVITKKQDGTEKERELFHFLTGERTGQIFRSQGCFPSSCAEVENQLPGKLRFIGWDFLYQEDLLDIIAECRKIMEEREDDSYEADHSGGNTGGR